MPEPKEICLEDLAAASLGERYLNCVAVRGDEPGLALDAHGVVLWRSDGPHACELWVSADERLVLVRPAGAPEVRVTRAGRSLDAPEGKPVILLDTWAMTPPPGGELDGVRRAASPAEAVELALGLG